MVELITRRLSARNVESGPPNLNPPVNVFFMGNPACSPFGPDGLDEEMQEDGVSIP
jgi:hypothetical protein